MATSWYMKPWKELYAQLHPDEKPPWRSPKEAQEWARSERDRLEPLVLEILRGQHPEKPWSSILFVVEAIPTQEIRDVLIKRTQGILDRNPARRLEPSSGDANILAYILDIFARAGDTRIHPIVLELITVDNQAPKVVEHCVKALRQLGTEESLPALRAIGLRESDVRMDRRCALAEKSIRMRHEGQDIFTNAEQELREVNEAYIDAIQNRDYLAYAAVHPYDFSQVVDEGEFMRRILPQHPDIVDILRALKGVAGREEFQIDRDNYQATLIVADRYKFTYVLEVDGWKITGPIRVGP